MLQCLPLDTDDEVEGVEACMTITETEYWQLDSTQQKYTFINALRSLCKVPGIPPPDFKLIWNFRTVFRKSAPYQDS